MDSLASLLALRDLPARLVVGLNSGTSADGVDAALVEISGSGAATRARLLAFATTPYDPGLRARLLAASTAPADELSRLDVLVGHAFADAAMALTATAPADVHLIGSHGQTISHDPAHGATLQIGQAAVIAERLGRPVVADFRARDVAAGGQGAPILAGADWLLFRQPGASRAVQNIGGIANVTVVPDDLGGVFAFDNGPGNMPLDAVVRAFWPSEGCDLGGARAAAGHIDRALIEELHAAPFFKQPPPRTTGREAFGEAWVAPLVARFAARPADLLATLTRFTAEAIRRSYAAHVEPRAPVAEVLVSGGGVHNLTLMAHLAELFAPIPVRSSASAGVNPDAKEAIGFAILANQTLFAQAANVPAATGARGPRVLGKIVL